MRPIRVSAVGIISLYSRQAFLTGVLVGQDVGLEEVADGVWNIVYYQTCSAGWTSARGRSPASDDVT
jgi:hypothetical protein